MVVFLFRLSRAAKFRTILCQKQMMYYLYKWIAMPILYEVFPHKIPVDSGVKCTVMIRKEQSKEQSLL